MKISKKCAALIVASVIGLGGNVMAADGTNQLFGDVDNYGASYCVGVGTQSYVMGYKSSVFGVGNGVANNYALAMGYNNYAAGTNSTAIGYGNEALAKSTTAIGSESLATAENATALGRKAYAGADAVAIGTESANTEEGTVSFGHKAGDFTGMYLNPDDNNQYSVKYEDTYTEVTYDSDKFSRLTNVADGTDDHDAATYGQVKTVAADLQQEAAARLAGEQALTNRIDSVERDATKGIAKASALAALHPLDYDSHNKFDVAAAGGFYRGENAFALGAFYRPNRNVMLSLATTVSGGDNAYNVGVTFKVGKSGKQEAAGVSNTELYAMIEAMQKRIEELEAAQGK